MLEAIKGSNVAHYFKGAESRRNKFSNLGHRTTQAESEFLGAVITVADL